MVLILWFSLNKMKWHKTAEVFLIGMSLWFYAYFNFSYLFIIVGSCLFNFLISYFINRIEKKIFVDSTISKLESDSYGKLEIKILGILGIIVNLGILFYYKYFDFFIENINYIFQKDYNLKNILLPLGISFFTFQQLSYVIDRMKGTAPHYGLIEYMSFVTFFPQLIAGPIVLHSELIPQFKDMEKRKFNIENFTDGCVQAILGLGKKVQYVIEPTLLDRHQKREERRSERHRSSLNPKSTSDGMLRPFEIQPEEKGETPRKENSPRRENPGSQPSRLHRIPKTDKIQTDTTGVVVIN